MMRWFGRLLYESTPVEFTSAYGLEEAVERLRAATKRSVFSAFGETAAVGTVSVQSVRLQRVIPMVGNSFKPFFFGRFETRGGATVLVGRFTMLPLVKVFVTFWFGMTGLFAAATLFGGFLPQGPHAMFFRLQPLFMVAFGVVLIVAGKWFARNDVAWLTDVINGALGNPGGTQGPSVSVDPDAVPMVLKGVAGFLAASSVVTLVMGAIGAQPVRGVGGQHVASDMWARWTAAYAVLMLVLSVGVWRRRPWAWWGGFCILLMSVVYSLIGMLKQAGVAEPPLLIRGLFIGFSFVIVAVWGKWWYAQKRHFIWG